MLQDQPFVFKPVIDTFDSFKGKYIRFTINGSMIYGFLKEVTPDGCLSVTNMPTTRPSTHGLESHIQEETIYFTISNISSIGPSSQEEINYVKQGLVPFEVYLGKPIIARDGSSSHFGILYGIFHEHILLLPSFNDSGNHKLVWNQDIPSYTKNVVELCETTLEELERIRTASELSQAISTKQKRLELKELELKNLHLDEALRELKPRLVLQ